MNINSFPIIFLDQGHGYAQNTPPPLSSEKTIQATDTRNQPGGKEEAGTTRPLTGPASTPAQESNQEQTAEHIESRLSPEELNLIKELKQTDIEVRRHEMAHVAAGGSLITSGANFNFKRGPDGKNYAVAGEVRIDTAPVPGDPQATHRKMEQIKKAALAPASPSGQDLKVASQATAQAAKALSEIMMLKAEQEAGSSERQVFGNPKQANDAYIKINNMPKKELGLNLAV